MRARPRLSLNGLVILFTGLRLLFNTGYRMVYPLLPVFGRGLGLDLTALSYALTVRSATSLTGLFLAPLADRYGRRLSMLVGMALFSLGSSLVIFFPTLTGFMLALSLSNIAMQIFIPAMQAYLADRVPYERLGRALGITEVSWALAFILGLPFITWLISRTGWSAPFPLLAGLGVLSVGLLWWLLPSDRPGRDAAQAALWSAFGMVLRSRTALLALGLGLALTVANEVVNFIFGVWLEDGLGLQIGALAAASAVIGVSELGGSSGSALLTDRIGKERSVGLGLLANCLAALLLPVISVNTAGALAGLFLFYLSFEFLLVSLLPLLSEIVPEARATMLALSIACFSAGRALGDLLSPLLYVNESIWGNAAMTVGLNLLALALLRQVSLRLAVRLTGPAAGEVTEA